MEVCVRDIRKNIEILSANGINNVEQYIETYDSILLVYYKIDELYDDETGYSRIRLKQSEWESEVNKWLEELDSYK